MSPRRRTRVTRPTALIYCEGEHDLIFMRLLKAYYASNDPPSRPRITVRKGRGGSAFGLVEDAARLEGFDRRLVKMDDDRNSKEKMRAKAIANKRGIILATTTPCIESLLLSILQPGKNYSGWSSEKCKSEFEAKYIPKDKRTTPEVYPKHLTKAKINIARSQIQELNDLINFIEQQ